MSHLSVVVYIPKCTPNMKTSMPKVHCLIGPSIALKTFSIWVLTEALLDFYIPRALLLLLERNLFAFLLVILRNLKEGAINIYRNSCYLRLELNCIAKQQAVTFERQIVTTYC